MRSLDMCKYIRIRYIGNTFEYLNFKFLEHQHIAFPLIQYNNQSVKLSLIETPLQERPYSSLAASLNKKSGNSQNYIVQTSNSLYTVHPDCILAFLILYDPSNDT